MSAALRFHGTLRTLVLARWRSGRDGQEFLWEPDGSATIKHVVEAMGVPHTEVSGIRVDGGPAAIEQVLREASVVDVLPWPPAHETPTDPESGSAPARFLADAHLGALARELRLLGFDTLLGGDEPDAVLAALSQAQDRILLSRDRELLKHRVVRTGCFVLSVRPDEQLAQVDLRFGLRDAMRPFTRCLECNGRLRTVARARVEDRLPPAVSASHDEFTLCGGCGRVYWRGSHWHKLNARVSAIRDRLGRQAS